MGELSSYILAPNKNKNETTTITTKLEVLIKLCSLVLVKYMITLNLSEILKKQPVSPSMLFWISGREDREKPG